MLNITKDCINKYWFQFGILFLLIYFLPYIFLGENSFITVWENLDSGVAGMQMLVATGWFPDHELLINKVMNGLSINVFHSKLNFIFLIFYFLPAFDAYVVNEFIVRVIAFLGMFLLLQKYIISDQNRLLTFVISIIFSSIPFMPLYGLSVPGQPLVIFALLNLINKETYWYNYAILIFFGLYSSLVLSGIFIITAATLILVFILFRTNKFPIFYVLGIATLCITYLVSEFQLINFMFFDDNFVSHRSTYVVPELSASRIYEDFLFALNLIFKTQAHMGPIYTFAIIMSILISLLISTKKTDVKNYKHFWSLEIGFPKFIPEKIKSVTLIISAIILFQFISSGITLLLHDKIALVKTFQFNRLYCLLTPLWILLFGMSLELLIKKKLFLIIYSLIFLQVLTITFDTMSRDYVKSIVYMISSYKTKASVSYKQFYDVELFTKIDHYINRPKEDYRIVSLGLYPSVTQYNGFYTLDSYQPTYPLDYKLKFRRIMRKELAKSERWKNYFDSWGSRCYLFSSELDWFAVGKHEMIEINNLEINTDVIKEMGGQYIFSAVKILNNDENNLVLEQIFETEESWWRIYLYRII